MTGYNYSTNPNNPLQRDRRKAQKESEQRERETLDKQVKVYESQIETIDKELAKINNVLHDPSHHSRPDLLVHRRRKKVLIDDKKALEIKRDQIKLA